MMLTWFKTCSSCVFFCFKLVGPSLYAKSQGLPVKIWGLLAGGRLQYFVLPADTKKKKGMQTTNMNGKRYHKLITTRFAKWRRLCFGDNKRATLVQDHEHCLWTPENLEAIRAAGFDVREDFPKSSPDLNAIETWWNRLKQKLEEEAPELVKGLVNQ